MKIDEANFKRTVNLIESGQMTNRKGAEILGYTESYFCTLRKKFKKKGDRIFIHGKKGVESPRKIPLDVRKFIRDKYNEETSLNAYPLTFNHFCRVVLQEEENIKISVKSVWNILNSFGIRSPECRKIKRKPTHRTRFRKEFEGELLQMDATPFQWLLWNGDTSYYASHAFLDDATSRITGMYICDNECRYGYIECRRQTIRDYGVELADYSDKAALFKNAAKVSIADQLQGKKKKEGDWARMNRELGVRQILAGSPQAKGKIERVWQTVQEYLPRMFRKYNADTIEKMNAVIESRFIPWYNRTFAKNIARTSAFRTFSGDNWDLENILCAKESRMVMRDGTISFEGLSFKVLGNARKGEFGDVCISEKGMWFLCGGERHSLELVPNKHGKTMSASVSFVLQSIIEKYMFNDCKLEAA